MALSVSFCPGSSCCSAEPTPSHAVRLSLVYGDVVAVVLAVVLAGWYGDGGDGGGLRLYDRAALTVGWWAGCLTWVHANTHGIARSVSTPPVGRRFAGREPTLSAASSSSGVADRK